MPVKILTCCSKGLVRSVGLADVLKLHFEPVDVLPVGLRSNSKATIKMLCDWADHIVVMEIRYAKRIPEELKEKLMVCEVGPDRYGNSHNRELIDYCWQWCRRNQKNLGIKEHFKKI